LAISILFNIGLLSSLKYSSFFMESIKTLFSFDQSLALKLLWPVGLSFYTLQKIGYIIDIYRGTVEVERNFVRFATFVAFFPKLIAGPIVASGHFLAQLRTERKVEWSQMVRGAEQMLWGFFKKMVIANSLALAVDLRFAAPEAHTSLSLMLGCLFYTFQIYCDFSGYSDIAIGLGRIMGFDLGVNFDRPYFATSFSGFWRRWHISLSQWLKDYVYIPLGGSRGGTLKTAGNVFITMLLCGLWHGTNWTYLVWGGLHGSYLLLQRAMSRLGDTGQTFPPMPKVFLQGFSMIAVFLLVSLAWIFFRASSVEQALRVLSGIASLDDLAFSSVPTRFVMVKGLFLIVFLLVIEGAPRLIPYISLIISRPSFRFVSAAILLWSIALLGVFSNNVFIYPQF
jgi:D-alanyl-lipoteichoic acid acyltransferase DltB (MBOAT superfamily)